MSIDRRVLKKFIVSIIPYYNFIWKWEVCKMLVEYMEDYEKRKKV
jgi:hypothetical protein